MRERDVWRLSAAELAAATASGRLGVAEATEACLARIAALDAEVNAFARLDAEGARRRARELDRARATGRKPGSLFGVPFSVKDLVVTKGLETAFGSHAMAGNVPDWEVVAITRLRRAGAILLGKTTTPEFGHKALTDSPRHGYTRNPWDLGRSPGGSSGGAAAAVAMGFGPVAVSTDGAGSSRIPASACGVLGLKPTLGRIPNEQMPELFGSFVNLGINARTTADLALMLSVMSGAHPKDPWSIGRPRRRFAVSRDPAAGLAGLRLLYIPRIENRLVDRDVASLMDRTLGRLADAGAAIAVMDQPFDWAKRAAFVIMRSYQRARLDRLLDTHRDRLDPSMAAALEEGRAMDLMEAQRAPQDRAALFQRVQDLFERADLLVTPTVSAPPPRFDHRVVEPFSINGELAGDLRATWYCYTGPFNITGHPAISVPMGFTSDGMPAGFHAVGPWYAEQRLIDLAAALETLAPWRDAWPALARRAQP